MYTAISICIGTSHIDISIAYAFLIAFIYYKASDIKQHYTNYKIIVTEGEGATIHNQEAKTPLDEIIFDLRDGIEKIEQICTGSALSKQKIYKKPKNTV